MALSATKRRVDTTKMHLGVLFVCTLLSVTSSTFATEDSLYLEHESSPSDPNKRYQALPLDPAEYYARVQEEKAKRRRRQRKRRKRIKGMSGSFSGSKYEKEEEPKKVKYAFMRPAESPIEEEECLPSSPISAFTFMNFVLAAASVTANVIDNVNSNNENNNNNNNNNNDVLVVVEKQIVVTNDNDNGRDDHNQTCNDWF